MCHELKVVYLISLVAKPILSMVNFLKKKRGSKSKDHRCRRIKRRKLRRNTSTQRVGVLKDNVNLVGDDNNSFGGDYGLSSWMDRDSDDYLTLTDHVSDWPYLNGAQDNSDDDVPTLVCTNDDGDTNYGWNAADDSLRYDTDHVSDDEGGSVESNNPLHMPYAPVALNKYNIKPKVNVLKNAFEEWWTASAGGSKTEETVCQIATTVVKFLHGVHNEALIANLTLPPSIGIIEFFVLLIVQVQLLACMNRYLMKYPFRPSTLASHLFDVLEVSRCLAMHSGATSTKGFSAGLRRFQTCTTNAIKGAKKTVRREQKAKDRSVETAVANKQYPARGMPELQAMVDADVVAMKLIMSERRRRRCCC